MTSYYDMSRDQAVAALEEFLRERAPALERLKRAMADDGAEVATVLDGTPESLTPLWRWAKSKLTRVPASERLEDPARMPTWLRYTTGRESTLTEDSLALVDGVLSYFCQVVERHVPQAEWRPGYNRNKAYLLQNHPVLRRGEDEVGPAHLVAPTARRYVKGIKDSPDDDLTRPARHVIARLGGDDAEEADADEPLVEVDGPDHGQFDVSVLEEIAHERSRLVDQLARALGEQPGVLEAFREDRERLIVRAPDWDAEQLQTFVADYLSEHL
jgi:hypothetical protein